MTKWQITNAHKKSAIEIMYWSKNDVTFETREGYRWGIWSCESDTKPDINFTEDDDEYEVSDDSRYEWSMVELMDGCWMDWDFPNSMSDEECERLQEAWEEDGIDGLEKLGWSCYDTAQLIAGPVKFIEHENI
jgi:uncharacterized UBP type Zn finger protein